MTRIFRAVPLIIVLTSLVCFSFVGCGGGGEGEEVPAASTESEAGEPMEGDDPGPAEEDM